MKVIDHFVGDYAFLNNFHPSTFYLNGKKYPTVEHAYQAHKTLDESVHETIRTAKTPFDAKRLGRSIQLRPDWEDVKVSLMREFIKQKFDNPFLSPQLLETGDAELIQRNKWNDKCWGVCARTGAGENWLGKILMEERARLYETSEKED